MAFISWSSIMALLGGPDVFSRRNDVHYWSGWVEEDGKTRKLKVTQVSLDESGLDVTIKEGEKPDLTLSAVPGNLSHTKVLVNEVLDPESSLIFAPKPSIFNLTRYAFDFRPVTLDGKEVRFNLRYDP